MSNSRFQKGSGVYKCNWCGKRTRETGEGESLVGICRHCWDEVGWENYIADGEDLSEVPEEFKYLIEQNK